MTVRVLIVEDHQLLAQSLAFRLREAGMEVVICPVRSGDEILEAARANEAEVVLLDLDLGGAVGSALPLIEPLHSLGARVVMVTGVTDRVRLAECVEAGALGVVSKAEGFDRLVEAVEDVVELGRLISPNQRQELLAELRRQRAERQRELADFERLTHREREVLAALIDGKAAETIAEDFVVALSTVRSQIRAILTKLGVNSQLEAVALARRAGWDASGGAG